MTMAVRWNINGSGQYLQTYLQRKMLENFEPELRFFDMGTKPSWAKGYNTLARPRLRRLIVTPASALLTEWVTPVETELKIDTISLTPKQFGIYATISDMLQDVAATPILANAATEVGANMARIIDADIQDTLESTGTNVIYANNNTWPRSNLGSGDTLKAADLAKAFAFLSTKGARQIGKGFVGVIHPNVAFDLMQQTGTGTFIDLNKYTDSNANKPLTGEVGMLFGVRIVTSSWIQTFASTVTVYPTYVMGAGAYGVANLQNLQMYVTGGSATDSDPLAQRRKVGAKVAFNSIILQQDALVRIESASSLNYTFL